MSTRTLITAVALGVAATSVSAERSVYFGFGADYGVPHSGDEQAFGSFIAGATFELWENIGVGIEGELGEPVFSGADDRETSRLRGLFIYDFDYADAVVSLGQVQYEAGDDTFDGYTVGLGVEKKILPRMNARFEFIRDFNGDDYGTNVTTSRFALFYTFN